MHKMISLLVLFTLLTRTAIPTNQTYTNTIKPGTTFISNSGVDIQTWLQGAFSQTIHPGGSLLGAQDGGLSTIAPVINGTKSFLRFDRAKYKPGHTDCFFVTVTDPDQNKKPTEVETVVVDIVDTYPQETATGDHENLTLAETDIDTGIFQNATCLSIQVDSPTLMDGILQVNPGDIISALYQDPDNPQSPQGLEEIDLSVDFALISGGMSKGLFTFSIDSSILPQELSSTPGKLLGESPRPVAMVINPRNVPQLFGEDQIVYLPQNEQDLEDFLAQRNGTVVDEITVPGTDSKPQEPTLKYSLIRIDPKQTDLDDLAYLAELFGAQGKHTFSSENAAKLMALILEEQLGGRFVMHNPLMWYFGAPITQEEGGQNGFNQPWFDTTDIRLQDAILYMDLIDRNTALSVDVAFIDGGFAGPDDYPPGDPLHGLTNPDYGLDFATIPQGNCDAISCAGSASGPYPISPFCAGGDGPQCNWHGTLVFSIAGAVGNNMSGTLGVAGHGRNSNGLDGQSGVIRPTFLKVGFPYMTDIARATNEAVERSVDIINISGGFACEPLLDIDICSGATRVALFIACVVLGTILEPFVPGPIAELLTSLGCESLVLFFYLTGVADEDVLRASIRRAYNQNITIVASGTENITVPILGELGPFDAVDDEFYPCAYREVICVGAIQGDNVGNRRPLNDNPFGSGITIWAPGDLPTMAIPGTNGNLSSLGGTSAAAPFITGVVALMKAADPLLTPMNIQSILQETSEPLMIDPPGCQPHPNPMRSSRCVGLVNAFEAVKTAAGVTLSCTGWDETRLRSSNETSFSAMDLGILPVPSGPGTITEERLDGDRAIHALSIDEDWFKFRVPNLPDSTPGDSVATRVRLTLPDPAFGNLEMTLYQDVDNTPSGISLLPIGSGNTLVGNLRNDRDYYIQIKAPAPTGINDNCYGGNTLTIEVLRPPAPDRYAGNGTPSQAADVTEDWAHPHHWLCPEWIRQELLDPDRECPDVFENGIISRGAEEIWTMVIPDLSIMDTTESDFFHILIPDPGNPGDGGHDDIRPSVGPFRDPPFEKVPLPECGIVHRQGIDISTGNPVPIDIGIVGKLIITVIPTGNPTSARPVSEEGETIQLYRDRDGNGTLDRDIALGSPTEGSLQKTIVCPRSHSNLTDLVFSFGERDEPRPDLFSTGGYEIRLVYKIEITREFPPSSAELLEQIFAQLQFAGNMPCLYDPFAFIGPAFLPSDDFPFCSSAVIDLDRVGLEAGHPVDATRTSCNADGCPEYSAFHWPAVNEPLDVVFTSDIDLTFELFDDEFNRIGEAIPYQPPPTDKPPLGSVQAKLLGSVTATDSVTKRLYVPQLDRGLYTLRISGPQAIYTMSFTPLKRADLSITKSDSPDPVITGANLSYTMIVANNGPGDATGILTTDALPMGVVFASATPSQGSCTEASNVVKCDVGNLDTGASTTILISVTPVAGGMVTNTVTVSGNEIDRDLSNNTASTSTTVILKVGIDIKPGNPRNPINSRSKGQFIVAILSSPEFDAPNDLDLSSITFGRTGGEGSLAFCQKNAKDVNHDGFEDLVCHFYTQLAGFQPGDAKGILKGNTIDDVTIVGQDSILIVPP